MTHTRMCQECPVSLEKLSFFFIQVIIIQVLVFDNWHPLNYLTVVSGVSSRPTMATCETGQVLLAGVPGGFSRGTPVFAPPTVWCFSYELK